MSDHDVTRARFAGSAARMGELGARRVEAFTRRLRALLPLTGEERALDAGTGTGTLAVALAPLVREVVGLDLVPEMLAEARRRAAGIENVFFVEGDALALPFEVGAFDLAASARTLHHLRRPELALVELGRVTRAGGLVLVVDQLASLDPHEAEAHNRIERLRDPSHARALSDADLRSLFEANGLAVAAAETRREDWRLGDFLAIAGCEGEARAGVTGAVADLLERGERAGIDLRREADGYAFTQTIGWYVLRKPASAT